MAAEAVGGRLLREVEGGTLEELLRSLRKLHDAQAHHPRKHTALGIPAVDALWNLHGPGPLCITGPGSLALLYHIASAAVSPPRSGLIVIVDATGRFDVTRLECSVEDMRHVLVYRPEAGRVQETVAGVEGFLLGGGHREGMGREWVGTVVNGGVGGDVMVGWKGWLRVESEKEEVSRFGVGVGIEEALRKREQRQEVVERKGWRAVCDLGGYRWDDE